MNERMDTLKAVATLSGNEINRISTAINWYWSRMGVVPELSEDEEEFIMQFTYDMYMDFDYANETWIMDEIVSRINDAENPHEYIKSLNGNINEQESIYVASLPY